MLVPYLYQAFTILDIIFLQSGRYEVSVMHATSVPKHVWMLDSSLVEVSENL